MSGGTGETGIRTLELHFNGFKTALSTTQPPLRDQYYWSLRVRSTSFVFSLQRYVMLIMIQQAWRNYAFSESNPNNVQTPLIETNKVLRNTYLLLSMTLGFSAIVSYYTATAGLPAPNIIVTLAGMFGLYFLTQSLRNSSWGILAVFAFTGFMGYVLGPILNVYIHGFSNGAQLIYTALGATGIVFLHSRLCTYNRERLLISGWVSCCRFYHRFFDDLRPCFLTWECSSSLLMV